MRLIDDNTVLVLPGYVWHPFLTIGIWGYFDYRRLFAIHQEIIVNGQSIVLLALKSMNEKKNLSVEEYVDFWKHALNL